MVAVKKIFRPVVFFRVFDGLGVGAGPSCIVSRNLLRGQRGPRTRSPRGALRPIREDELRGTIWFGVAA